MHEHRKLKTVIDYGKKVLGRVKLTRWLFQENTALGGRIPVNILAEGNYQSVRDELGKIEHGNLS